MLTEQQVFEIMQAQKRQGVPFGVLAETMFDVTAPTIERAWIEQYGRLTGSIDLKRESIDDEVLRMISRRQAWQFEVLHRCSTTSPPASCWWRLRAAGWRGR